MAKKTRRVKKKKAPTANSAASNTVASANSQTMIGQIAGIEELSSQPLRGTRSAANPRMSKSKSAASNKSKSAKSAASNKSKSAKSAASNKSKSAKSAAGSPGSANTDRAAMKSKEPSGLTPFFEGANAFDPEVGYYRVAPGQNPQEVLEDLKRQRGMSTNRSRTVRGE